MIGPFDRVVFEEFEALSILSKAYQGLESIHPL
jgi:hypothetical protein